MKTNKELLQAEFGKVWDTDRMADYCTNKAATMAILPDGGIVTVDKQRIEKDFCYGESGYDMDDAIDMCETARTSQDYFFRKNMSYFTSWINDLEETKQDRRNWMLFIMDNAYTGQPDSCKIRGIYMVRTCEVLEETGPAFLHELFGKRIKIRGMEGHLATLEEIELIEEAYKEAAADHEKKVRSYLKRYGTSKVRAWTYWRDA